MNESRSTIAQRPRATKRAPVAALALLALVGLIASGCIRNYDPRDESRIDSPGTPGIVRA
jgi:hypothetical protein